MLAVSVASLPRVVMNKKSPLTPSIPRPTTHIPITAPPEKATERAPDIPDSLAALAVLTLAFVATFIPKNPAKVEKAAPIRKHTPVKRLIPNVNTANNTKTKTMRVLYSLIKKAIAPSCMKDEISFILSVPSLTLLIVPDK